MFLFLAIVVGPETQYVPINSGEGVFYCKAVGLSTFWHINNKQFDSGNRTENEYKFSEIVTSSPSMQNDHDMTLSMPARLEFNGTGVRCSAYSDQRNYSNNALLIVMGKSFSYTSY